MALLVIALLPVFSALGLRCVGSRKTREICAFLVTCLTSLAVCWAVMTGAGENPLELFRLSDSFRFVLRLDGAGKVYIGVAALLWPLAVLYAIEYMRHEHREGYFYTWYLLTYGAAVLLAASDNLFTLYIAYEFLTLCTVPLVWHEKNEESNRAALQYMLFLIGGAALGFAAMLGLTAWGVGDFHRALEGGVDSSGTWFRMLCLAGFLGFGVKAAVLPMCHWLPTASVAPTPVTALLHAVAVVNAGVFAVARFLYYALPAGILRGTWVQTVLLILSAATIVYGAARAVREQHVKRRLAWSTVSNLSYMLLGLSLMTEQGMTAGLSHMVFHSFMKIILFFCAGTVMVQTGRTNLRQMHGLGRTMPLTFLCFTLAGVSLLGVPPLPGFVSKYALVTAAFEEGSALAIVGAAALLVAAVLTAIYIFTMVYPAFFMKLHPEKGETLSGDPGWRMKVSLILLSILLISAGVFAGRIMAYLTELAGGVFS